MVLQSGLREQAALVFIDGAAALPDSAAIHFRHLHAPPELKLIRGCGEEKICIGDMVNG